MMTKEEFYSIEKLYHYTNFCSALKIIESNTLLFNPLNRMNDINELYRPIFFRTEFYTEENAKKMSSMLYSHQQISLTRDKKDKMGFDIPAMWGHYADKGLGLCLIFDKNKLLNMLSKEHMKGHVFYQSSDKFDPDILINEENLTINKFSKKEYNEYFFKKTNDWRYEQEYRVLVKSDSSEREILKLGDSLIGVVANRAEDVRDDEKFWSSVNYQLLKKFCATIFIYESWGKERHLQTYSGDCVWSSFNLNQYKMDI